MIVEENKLWRNKLIIKTVESIWKMLDVWNKILENAKQLMFLSLESVNDIKWCNCFTLDVFDVYYSVTKNTFKKNFKNTANFIVNYSRNTLDIITIHEIINNELDDICDVVLKNLAIMFNIILNHAYNVVLKNLVVMLNITLNYIHNVVLKNLAVMLSITFNDIYDVVLKNLAIMLNITLNYTYNVVLKNFIIMLNITLNHAHDIVSKNLVITFSIALFKTFIIFVICWKTC